MSNGGGILKLDITTIQQFLYETYNIDFRTTAKKIIKTANLQEKKTLNRHLTLYNLFQLRRCKDPGFFQYVTRIVESDEDTLLSLKQYLEHIIAKHGHDQYSTLFNLDIIPQKKELTISDLKRTQPQDIDSNKFEEFINAESQASIKYFQKRYEHALKTGNYEESAAILSITHDYATYKFFIDELFQEDSIYQGFNTETNWELERKRFIFQKIRFADIYFDNKHIGNPLFQALIPISPQFLKEISKIFQLKHLDTTGKNDDLPFVPQKFHWDALSIASEIWFNGLSEKEKITILNKEYPFKFTSKTLDLLTYQFRNLNAIYRLANDLYSINYHDTAIELYQFLLTKTESRAFKHLSNDAIASSYRELGNYEGALAHYQRALDFIDDDYGNIQSDSFKVATLTNIKNIPQYTRAISMKNIGEMHHQLGNNSESEKWFNYVLSIAKGAPDNDKEAIFWNLAFANRRIGNFKKEHEYIIAGLSILEKSDQTDKSEKLEIIHQRLQILSDQQYLTSGFSYDIKKLKELDSLPKREKFVTRAEFTYLSFQLSKANQWLECALKIKVDYFHKFRIGRTNYELGNFSIASSIFNDVIQNSKNDMLAARSYGYLGLIDVILSSERQERFEEGILKIEKCFELLYKDYALSENVLSDENIFYQNISWAICDCIFATSTYLRDKKDFFTLFDRIERKIAENENVMSSYSGVAESLCLFGFTREAHHYIDLGLKNENRIPQRALLFENKGRVFHKEGKYDLAIEMFKKSIEEAPELESQRVLFAIAQSYASKLDFHEAENYAIKALEEVPEDAKFQKAVKDYHQLAEQVINFNKITNPDVKTILMSAESMSLRLFNVIDQQSDFDYSIALVQYGKALESILHDRIGKDIRERVFKKYGSPLEKKYIVGVWDEKNGKKYYKIKPLPKALKNLLAIEERSISLGQWMYITNDLKKNFSNPVVKNIFSYFSDRFNGDIDYIVDACDVISELRNNSAHLDIKNKNDVLKFRNEINYILNDILNRLYI